MANQEIHSTISGQARNCQNCKQDFVIEPEDFNFYEKMKVPPPTWCPECRTIRRFSFTNVWNLYKQTCAKCGKSVVSMYSPDKPFTIYCMPCWWADDWDGTEYGMDYDSSRLFLEQLKELNLKIPRAALEANYLTNIRCEYTNALGHCKDSYLIFWADFCENAFYSSFLNGLKDSLDCYRAKDSELCYEDVSIYKCYRTFFSEECDSCTYVWFSRNCTGCTNCFGCINLRNKSYYIFNEPYSREAYFEKLKELKLDSREALATIKNQVYEFWRKYPQRVYIGSSLNVNVSGDYVYNSKNTHDAYLVDGVEDARYVQFISVAPARDCYDYSGWGDGVEKVYESAVVGEGASGVKFSAECWPNVMDIEYSIYAISCKHVFGCSGLKRKEYCILNKQYSKEEYEKLSAQIREDMVKNPYTDSLGRKWSYGEFLPIDLSAFAYNETIAQQYFPKTKEGAMAEGFGWHEVEVNQYAITKKWNEVPDTIVKTDVSVLKEVIGCAECGKAFRIVQGEFDLMQKLNLPLPARCSNCRQKARFARTNLPGLYDRTCAKCSKPIKTSYAPERPEIVYCEQCYQAEVA